MLVLAVVAVTAPAGASSSEAANCSGFVRSGRRAACSTSLSIPHFNSRDAIDYASLVARIESPSARSWQVAGSLTDARGVVYFAWSCSASRSSTSAGGETYVGRSCRAWRKMVNIRRGGRTYTTYYAADTTRPQRLRVTAKVGSCVGTPLRGCRFVGKAVYRIS
jgi:hypothetical protein